MPVNKPTQILGGGTSPSPIVKKARQSAAEKRAAMSAALGLDNFSQLLKSNPAMAVETFKSQHPDMAGSGGALQIPPQGQAQSQAGQRQAALQPGYPELSPAQALRFSTDPADVQNLKGMTKLQKIMMQSEDPLGLVNSLKPINGMRPRGDEAAQLALRTRSHKTHRPSPAEPAAPETPPDKSVGQVSAVFESGQDGIAAIGYDSTGGTSYGKYQIASKTGTMDQFISFLKDQAPDLAKRLQEAGPANTGSRRGKMPEAWKGIAAEQPERFAQLQQSFIGRSHYSPALNRLSEQTGISEAELSPAMREAIFSTAVQHGAAGAGRIISRALNAVGLDRLRSQNSAESQKAEQEVIRQIYDNRAGQFSSSTSQVRASVQNRLQNEMNLVLAMAKQAPMA